MINYKTYSIPRSVSKKLPSYNRDTIETELKQVIKGEVRFDPGYRSIYATDSSNYRQVPIGVVIPSNEDDVINTVKICNHHQVPVLSRGGGTSLAGQCCNIAVVMDMSKYRNKILNIDTKNNLVTVEPGIVLDELNKELDKHNLIFGPDPATHSHCTLGGMIGNNSCGVHSVMAAIFGLGARTSDNLYEMEVLTYDGLKLKVGPTSEEELNKIISEGGRRGEIYQGLKNIRDKYADEVRKRYPKIPRRVSGYNLDDLLPEKGFNVARALAGTESTCITILNATLHLLPNFKARSQVILGYPNISEAGGHAYELLKYKPTGMEGMDDLLYDYMVNRKMHVDDLKLLPEGKSWLIAEFGGATKEESDANAKVMMDDLKKTGKAPSMRLIDEPEEEEKVWKVRDSGLGATAFVPGLPDSWEGWEDSAVHPKDLGNYITDYKNLLSKFGYKSAIYGHFGQGIVHCRINFDLVTAEGINHYRNFVEEASDLVIKYNGSYSGEHGDGQSKAELLPKMYGEKIIEAFREYKTIWDPQGMMNPGKIVDPFPIISNLRLGTNYNPIQRETYFKYPSDRNTFSRAVLKCVGVGECRRNEGGTMCPSYMVTKEEMHSTRGRAHALFEMMRGEVNTDGWKSKFVKESLDLCLACKGCKGDCPVKVDMATYKAEFYSHYYKNKLRPISAYIFGHIDTWSRIGSKFPSLTNFILNSKITGPLVKAIGGIAQKRKMPEYAKETFKNWFFKRKVINEGKPQVILWADTFNNYFHPEVCIAATEVLEHLGFQVKVYKEPLCCGRPLYDFGMLDAAKDKLKNILSLVKDDIRSGTALIGLEPSCTAVFRDELINLFPNNEDAKRLSESTFFLSEFLNEKLTDDSIPKLNTKVFVHGHCHHKAALNFNEEIDLLKKMGAELEAPNHGCCGMAGSFGYDKNYYDISIKVGDHLVMPTIRKIENNKPIITNGFSCTNQINHQTGRKTLHIAEVLRMAINGKG